MSFVCLCFTVCWIILVLDNLVGSMSGGGLQEHQSDAIMASF